MDEPKESPPDPSVYFAAERTLLSWLRTGIGVMAFGFVVARFGLFLRVIAASTQFPPPSALSPYLGAGLVGLGALAAAMGAARFRSFCRRLPRETLPAPGAAGAPFYLTMLIVVIGFALAIVLVA